MLLLEKEVGKGRLLNCLVSNFHENELQIDLQHSKSFYPRTSVCVPRAIRTTYKATPYFWPNNLTLESE